METICELRENNAVLRSELEEKNLLVHTLLLREANDSHNFIHSHNISNKMENAELIETTSDNSLNITTEFDESMTTNSVDSNNTSLNTSYADYNELQFDNENQSIKLVDYEDSDFNDISSVNIPECNQGIWCYMSFEDQLSNYRKLNHAVFLNANEIIKSNNNNNSVDNSITEDSYLRNDILSLKNHSQHKSNTIHKWPSHTILVASDSMLQNLDERRLCKNNFNVKVRAFRGSTINDMYDYLKPLLRKEPERFCKLYVK